jgi:hypothetical protein
MQVERALNSQQLSQSWSEVLREKQIALEVAIEEVERTRQHADQVVRDKALVASQIEEEYRLFVRQARSELKEHIDEARSAAESRRKKERAVRRDLAEAQSFALAQDSRERAAGASRPANSRRDVGREERDEDLSRSEWDDAEDGAIDEALSKAQVIISMLLQ